jgi:hypothetical protein
MNKLLLIILCLTTTTIALDEEPESIHINKLEILLYGSDPLYGSHKVQVLKDGEVLAGLDCYDGSRNSCTIDIDVLIGSIKYEYKGRLSHKYIGRLSPENIKFALSRDNGLVFSRAPIYCDDSESITINKELNTVEFMADDTRCPEPPDDEPGLPPSIMD